MRTPGRHGSPGSVAIRNTQTRARRPAQTAIDTRHASCKRATDAGRVGFRAAPAPGGNTAGTLSATATGLHAYPLAREGSWACASYQWERAGPHTITRRCKLLRKNLPGFARRFCKRCQKFLITWPAPHPGGQGTGRRGDYRRVEVLGRFRRFYSLACVRCCVCHWSASCATSAAMPWLAW